MELKSYNIPVQVIDAEEESRLVTLTNQYEKMVTPSLAAQAVNIVANKIPDSVKIVASATKDMLSDSDLFLKSMELLAKAFHTLEQYAAKVTLSESYITGLVDSFTPDNQIVSLDEICLARAYDVSKLVEKYKFTDIIAALVEGAATGFPGFAGIPFNILLSNFLFYRAVQSVALFYGYDVKTDPIELAIASEVFQSATSPKINNKSELSNTIAKIMLFTTATSVKQTINKGWTAMAEKGGVHLLITQMRALANSAAKKALEKAGKSGLERTMFSEVFEQIGKQLTQKSIKSSLPAVGAIVGATLDTSQMIHIINFANIFYCKRFIIEKEKRIDILLHKSDNSNVDYYIDENEICVEEE